MRYVMTQAYDTAERTLTSQLVAWCPDCCWYIGENQIGTACPAASCPRTLVKRRFVICSACGNAFKTMKGAKSHECDD